MSTYLVHIVLNFIMRASSFRQHVKNQKKLEWTPQSLVQAEMFRVVSNLKN